MKSQQLSAVVCFAVLFSFQAFAQVQIPAQAAKPVPVPEQEEQEPEAVFRINTKLVQIDAVVTGKGGAHADDLTEDDFELFINGKKQELSYFRLIKTVANPTGTPKPLDPKAPLPPSSGAIKSVAPEQVQRTIAFVIDDL
ncbi:MAG TPA: hypothetical protein VEF04_01455, partial [Blastocatellia bacterium]|nr:hypothetical protein [Blastocatellia bacterium]